MDPPSYFENDEKDDLNYEISIRCGTCNFVEITTFDSCRKRICITGHIFVELDVPERFIGLMAERQIIMKKLRSYYFFLEIAWQLFPNFDRELPPPEKYHVISNL